MSWLEELRSLVGFDDLWGRLFGKYVGVIGVILCGCFVSVWGEGEVERCKLDGIIVVDEGKVVSFIVDCRWFFFNVWILFVLGRKDVVGWFFRVFYKLCKLCWGEFGGGEDCSLGFDVGFCRSFFNVEFDEDFLVFCGDFVDCCDVFFNEIGVNSGDVGGEMGVEFFIWDCIDMLRSVFKMCLIFLCFVCFCLSLYWRKDVFVFSFKIVFFSNVMFVSNFWIFLGRLCEV